jgi:protoporphyrin/coproporphyrin ferrochelatase
VTEERKKKAVLLMAYGSPERDEDVEAYYTHIRGGSKPTREELENLKSRYQAIGGISPLLRITDSTAEKLRRRLNSQQKAVRVYAGMKHWHPFISETFRQISDDGTTDLIAIALAPHYSKMSIGSYEAAVKKANEDHGDKIVVKYVDEWYLNPVFLTRWKERIVKAAKEKFDTNANNQDEIFFLFSAHSLPERILIWKDPYKDQLLETADRLAKELKLDSDHFGFAFQSAGHTSEPWLGPDILDKLRELAANGWKNVLVIPIGFVSDHLEILFDIDVEANQLANELGIRVERTDSFNDSDEFVDVLASVVEDYLK